MTQDDTGRPHEASPVMSSPTSQAPRPESPESTNAGEVQRWSHADTHVYEAIATLEKDGRSTRRDDVVRTTGLTENEVSATLSRLVHEYLLVREHADGRIALGEHPWASEDSASRQLPP